jgi:quercetin dioxygenase-like cupin family protein
MKTQVLRADRDFVPLPLIEGGGEARAIVWPGMGARHRSMHYIALGAGGQTVKHWHPDSEAVYYIIEGEGEIHDLNAGTSHPIHPGSVLLITPGTRYEIRASSSGVTFVGGPCPPDPALYASIGGRS